MLFDSSGLTFSGNKVSYGLQFRFAKESVCACTGMIWGRSSAAAMHSAFSGGKNQLFISQLDQEITSSSINCVHYTMPSSPCQACFHFFRLFSSVFHCVLYLPFLISTFWHASKTADGMKIPSAVKIRCCSFKIRKGRLQSLPARSGRGQLPRRPSGANVRRPRLGRRYA